MYAWLDTSMVRLVGGLVRVGALLPVLVCGACSGTDSDSAAVVGSGGSSASTGGSPGSALGGAASGGAANGSGGSAAAQSVALTFAWSLTQVADTAKPVDCATAGFAVVGVQLWSPALGRTLRWFEGCPGLGFRTTVELPPGQYSATFGLLDDVFDTEADLTAPATVTFDLAAGAAAVTVPTGSITFARYTFQWSLARASTAIDCTAAGAAWVEVSVSQPPVTTTWRAACSPPAASTLLGLGSYAWQAKLTDSARAALASFVPTQALIVTERSASPLAPILFELP